MADIADQSVVINSAEGRMAHLVKQSCWFCAAVLVCAGHATILLADRVEVNDGRVFNGKITENGKENVAINVNHNGISASMNWPRTEVKEVITFDSTVQGDSHHSGNRCGAADARESCRHCGNPKNRDADGSAECRR